MKSLRERAFPIIMGCLVGLILLFITNQPTGALFQRADQTLLKALAAFGGENTELTGISSDNALRLSRLQPSPPSNFELVLITDDPAEIFEERPPSPIDLALLLSTLRKKGAQKIAIDYPLTWSEVEPIGVGLLELEIEKFGESSLAFPLSRSSEPSLLPAQWEASTLPITEKSQLPPSIPLVNRIPIEPATYGSEDTLLGFSYIESELREVDKPYLLARWGDRLLVSSYITALLTENALDISDLQVTRTALGLGKNGQSIPLDRYGRAVLSDQAPLHSATDAEDLIAPPDNFEQPERLSSVYLSSEADNRTGTLLRLAASDRLVPVRSLHKLPLAVHAVLVVALSIAIVLLRPHGALWRVASLILSISLLGLALTALMQEGHWTSTLSLLGTAIVASLFPVPPKVPTSAKITS